MGKKSKRIRNKQPKEYKNKADRLVEYTNIKQQFLNNGFKNDDEGIKEILAVIERFYKTGQSWSGTINIPHTEYKANILLTNNKHKQNIVKLEYNKL